MRTLRKVRNACRTGLRASCWAVVFLLAATPAFGQQPGRDWQKQVREQVQRGQLDAALAMVGERLAMHGEDLEAHAWRGRLLAWKGRWPQAEGEYRFVLQHAPHDVEVLTGLADVLLWQGRAEEALGALETARGISPSEPDVLLRRARVLRVLGREREAREDFRRVLVAEPNNAEAKKGIAGQAGETRYELRFGHDVDTFNYTDSAQAQSVSFISRWGQRWSSTLSVSSYERLDETAAKFSGSAAYRLTQRDWLSGGGAAAHDRGLIPKREVFSEYGHAFRFPNPWIRGWEISSQQHWFWYRGAHVLTLGASQNFYLPKDWLWGFTFTEGRSGFSGSGVEWVPSGSTRLRFPLQRRLTGNVLFAVGSENFARVDQIGRFAARTFGGGLRYQFTGNQDVSGYIAAQDRSQRRSQNSYGLSYGVRF